MTRNFQNGKQMSNVTLVMHNSKDGTFDFEGGSLRSNFSECDGFLALELQERCTHEIVHTKLEC